MGSEIPEWAANEAEGIAASIPLGTLPETQEAEVVEIIARALVAAERRGEEKLQRKLDLMAAAISFVRRWAVHKEGNITSAEDRLSAIAHHPAIRQLGDTP